MVSPELYSLIIDVDDGKTKPKYREYCRDIFHKVIEETLKPLADVMHSGIAIQCSDGVERLCFPILSQYIADMEEQVILGGIIKGHCPKCLGTTGKLETQPAAGTNPYPLPRTDTHARNARHRAIEIDNPQELRRLGYHANEPFSALYPRGRILDALGPDLLH
jgi:hypothetical protein